MRKGQTFHDEHRKGPDAMPARSFLHRGEPYWVSLLLKVVPRLDPFEGYMPRASVSTDFRLRAHCESR